MSKNQEKRSWGGILCSRQWEQPVQNDKQKQVHLRTEGHVPGCRGEEGRLGSLTGPDCDSLGSQRVEDFVLKAPGATGGFKPQSSLSNL